MLPESPKSESIGNPQAAHPLPIKPKKELPPTVTCNPDACSNISFCKTRVRFTPVKSAVKNRIINPKLVIVVNIPSNNANNKSNLYVMGNGFTNVSHTNSQFIKKTAKIRYIPAIKATGSISRIILTICHIILVVDQ